MPDVSSLTDYLENVKEAYIPELFLGGKLLPFNLTRNAYNWVLYDCDLCPGSYRLCLQLVSDWLVRPVSAYAVAYAPGEKPIKEPTTGTLGYGFNITPSIANGNNFLLSRNVTDFITRFNGIHQIGVTTSFWTPDTANTCFEVLLLRKKQVHY
ncbi:MAG TPA: hypothetical protein VMW28_09415 [Pelolinea sp.]|nr:hypothetical protein [Pelolinea sp.]